MTLDGEAQRYQVQNLKIEIYPTSEATGAAAARAAADALIQIAKRKDTGAIIFATGASQLDTLRALTEIPDLPWANIRGGSTWMSTSACPRTIRRLSVAICGNT